MLPIGLMQTHEAVNVGYSYARSSEFTQTPIVHILEWATGHSYRRRDVATDPMPGKPAPIRASDSNAA